MSAPTPLVSVVWYGKNRLEWAEKEIDSLLRQSHSNWQLVVEDAGSTDGTFEWFQRLAGRDKRIDVGSRAASTPGAALLRALRRCTGKYIAICPSQAVFLPDALEFAVHTLDRSPESGALACLGLLVDAEGEAAPVPFDIVMALFTPLRIAPASGVIRRSALVESGLMRNDWRSGCVAFDTWCRIAMDHDVTTVDRAIVDGKVRPDIADASADPDQLVEDRLSYVQALFEEHHFFGADDLALKYECMANQLSMLQEDCGRRSVRALDRQCWRLAQKFVHLASYDGRAVRSLRRWRHMWRMSDHLEELARIFEPPHPGRAARREKLLLFFATHVRALCWPFVRSALRARSRNFGKTVGGLRAVFADVYARQAERYIAHGQVATALRNWQLAEHIGDAMLDGTALQAEIKLPGATEASLASAHKRWAARHAPATADTEDEDLPRWSGRRKIRVGYHCAFMPSDTIRYMMGRVLRAHDRDRFEIYGYSPLPVPSDIAAGFDVLRDTATSRDDPERVRFHNTQMISHAAFRRMIREDRVDVFVELTGFSPGHRFPAMAARCAPVQVSFLNHTASSQVQNVDYIFADEISLPTSGGFEAHYSEQIYRLPGCFFCFDYRESESPPIAEPPSLAKGYVTFGCFGYGGKLNSQLLRLWAELLRQVPTSRLHLQNSQIKTERGRRFLAERFRSFGIGPERLILAVGVDRQSLLEAYADIDISLDTWPYCGGNSIAESLWHGVPVITLKGNRFSSRYGASLVTAAGCGDLVADSPEQYIAIAKQLAGDPARLASLRQRLRDMSIEHGLGDSAGFARRLEDAYIEMLSRRGNQSPARTESADGGAARSKLISQQSFR